MKLKYYMRGLGTGIIFTAVILMIVFSYKTTDAKIMERAKELGMVKASEVEKQETKPVAGGDKNSEKTTEETTTPKESEKTTLQETTTPKESETTTLQETTTPKEPETTTMPETTTPKESETTTMTETTTPNQSDSDNGEQETTPPTGTYTYTVAKGMTSEKVSADLAKAGVIDNEKDFNSYLIVNGYANRIKTGTYTFNIGSSYEEIARAVTGN